MAVEAPPARSIADLPGPRRLPLIGNAHQVRTSRLHLAAEEWCERYGPIFRFDLGSKRIVAVSDLDEINRVLRDRPDGFRRAREVGEVGFDVAFGADGVFSAEGEDWRRMRRLAVTALNSNHLQRYFHVVRTATERLHRLLSEAARDRRSLDISRELTSFSVDVTSALAFGHDLNTLERRHNKLQDHIQRVFEMSGRRIFAPLPYWRWVKLPADRAFDRSLLELRRAVEGFIEQARQRMRASPELGVSPENFLEGMLVAEQADGAFTDEEIIANTLTLLNAGEDTTAHTMAWTIWCLAKAPEVQRRWAAEACDVLGEHRFPVDYETIESLRYGEAVLRESMRLRSVAPMILVESLIETTIAGTRIPAGSRVLLLTRHACRRAVGAEYDPERWLGDDDEHAAPGQKSFLTFGAGPRFCPGRNLAFLESKTAMAMIARNFEIELDDSHDSVTERFSFTMIPEGLRVRLRQRAAARAAVPAGDGGTERL